MRASRLTLCAAMIGALALPTFAATSANAAPQSAPTTAITRSCHDPGPWVVGTKAVTIRSKPSKKSTSVGILYRGHKFSVHKTRGKWRHITDKTTGVKGWVSAAYVYRDSRMCLD
ncbi:SH3 domain-containing protein [Streptomyces albus]|uniref:SH3 domain-containing protein n=1 Tax=Streptomyces albus TaxID=1888 RepID=UPI003F1C49E9